MTDEARPVHTAEYVRPLRTPKLRPVASGWDWSEDVPKPAPETLTKLRALDAHVARARFTARFCYVR